MRPFHPGSRLAVGPGGTWSTAGWADGRVAARYEPVRKCALARRTAPASRRRRRSRRTAAASLRRSRPLQEDSGEVVGPGELRPVAGRQVDVLEVAHLAELA